MRIIILEAVRTTMGKAGSESSGSLLKGVEAASPPSSSERKLRANCPPSGDAFSNRVEFEEPTLIRDLKNSAATELIAKPGVDFGDELGV